MGVLIDIISAMRTIRGETGIPPALALDAVVHPTDPLPAGPDRRLPGPDRHPRATAVDPVTDATERPKASASAVARGATVHVPLEGIIDFRQASGNVWAKELAKLDKELASIAKKLQNQDFLAKAAPEVVPKVRDQQQELLDKQRKIKSNLDKIREYDSAS